MGGLGHEGAVFYRRAQLKEFVRMHSRHDGGPLSDDEVQIIGSALDMTVSDIAYTRCANVYCHTAGEDRGQGHDAYRQDFHDSHRSEI